MGKALHLVLWLFVGALCVLVIKNAGSFATAVNAVGGQLTNDANLLAGNPVTPTTSQGNASGRRVA